MPTDAEGGRGQLALYAEPTKDDLAEMTAESLCYLRAIVKSVPEGRQMGAGIAAASRVLEYARWREEFTFEREQSLVKPEEMLVQLLGSEEKLVAWMQGVLPRLEAKLRANAAPEVPSDDRGRER